jgi:hypothetical protein
MEGTRTTGTLTGLLPSAIAGDRSIRRSPGIKGRRLEHQTGSCPDCTEPLAGYELIVALDPDCVRVTSLAREPHLLDEAYELLHPRCFVARRNEAP